MAEVRKGSKKALFEALESGKEHTLSPEEIQSTNVEVQRVSLKNWIVIFDHDPDDPIVSLHTAKAEE